MTQRSVAVIDAMVEKPLLDMLQGTILYTDVERTREQHFAAYHAAQD